MRNCRRTQLRGFFGIVRQDCAEVEVASETSFLQVNSIRAPIEIVCRSQYLISELMVFPRHRVIEGVRVNRGGLHAKLLADRRPFDRVAVAID